ncbi:hypothetical protein [Azospirillum largimobile]
MQKGVGHLPILRMPVEAAIAFQFVVDPACDPDDLTLHGVRVVDRWHEQDPKLLVSVFPAGCRGDGR